MLNTSANSERLDVSQQKNCKTEKENLNLSSDGQNLSIESNPGKTKQCRFFKSKTGCRFKANRSFAHSDEKLPATNPANSMTERKTENISNKNGSTKVPETEKNVSKEFAKVQAPVVDKHQTKLAPVCKYYSQVHGRCNRGNHCQYRHVRNGEEITIDSFTRGMSKNPPKSVCSYWLKGNCNKGDGCQFFHEKGPYTVSGNSSRIGMPLVSKPVYEWKSEDLSSVELLKIRATELKYLSVRYPSGLLAGNTFSLTFVPSDPDWPFDVKTLFIDLIVPEDYPHQRISIRLSQDNVSVPEEVLQTLELSIDGWMRDAYRAVSEAGCVSLYAKKFFIWLDRHAEELLTEALMQHRKRLVAEQAGLEFVTAKELKSRLKTNNAGKTSESSQSGSEKYETEDDYSEKELDETDRVIPEVAQTASGLEIRLSELKLGTQVASLVITKVSAIIHCSRCRNHSDLLTVPNQDNVLNCGQCHLNLGFKFRCNLVHANTNILGWADQNDCSLHDLVLPQSDFQAVCLQCDKSMPVKGLCSGFVWDSWCHTCHAKLTISVDAVQLIKAKTCEVDLLNGKRISKKSKDQELKLQHGKPLPNNGICKHFKKSHRWFRFPCCGKAYPCDACHEDSEDGHEMLRANRMICGFCSKEQPFADDRECIACGSSLTKRNTSHWENGKGCRDKVKMSKNDSQKYTDLGKTVSRRLKNKTSSVKKTKLRHS